MAFKLMQDGGDWPVLVCDVCGNRLYDPFGDLASGTRSGGLTDIVIHHQACPTDKEVHMPLTSFALFAIKNRYGDCTSDGATEVAILSMDAGEGLK